MRLSAAKSLQSFILVVSLIVSELTHKMFKGVIFFSPIRGPDFRKGEKLNFSPSDFPISTELME